MDLVLAGGGLALSHGGTAVPGLWNYPMLLFCVSGTDRSSARSHVLTWAFWSNVLSVCHVLCCRCAAFASRCCFVTPCYCNFCLRSWGPRIRAPQHGWHSRVDSLAAAADQRRPCP